MRPWTDTQTRDDHNTFRVVYDSREMYTHDGQRTLPTGGFDNRYFTEAR